MRASTRLSGRVCAPSAILLLLLTAGCQTTATGGTDLSCRAFKPIHWSRADTPGTARQARSHNAAWTSLCKNDTTVGR